MLKTELNSYDKNLKIVLSDNFVSIVPLTLQTSKLPHKILGTLEENGLISYKFLDHNFPIFTTDNRSSVFPDSCWVPKVFLSLFYSPLILEKLECLVRVWKISSPVEKVVFYNLQDLLNSCQVCKTLYYYMPLRLKFLSHTPPTDLMIRMIKRSSKFYSPLSSFKYNYGSILDISPYKVDKGMKRIVIHHI